ncbi:MULTISPECIES: hypothetical protein [Thalassospira]|uniref:hypothetical protein n=1 Tax=Thalassospira TaxID=168934 RepID=UPI000EF0E6EE|nr:MULTISPECIES: hypothetical protein [Thalassospira]MBO6806933.1 hypothetical protein [Thalassospira sp.]MBO6842479.1 hypothetical protein [Thalassospira sp.]MBS8273092.1 hypothetical protein [Thalassospira tepidiphila]HAI32770.1 hypothetical protein [Thalassospira sp.]
MYQFARKLVRLYQDKNFRGINLTVLIIWPIISGFLILTRVLQASLFEAWLLFAWAFIGVVFSPRRARGARLVKTLLLYRLWPLPGPEIIYAIALMPFMVMVYLRVLEGPEPMVPFFSIAFGWYFGAFILFFRPWFLRLFFGVDKNTKILKAWRYSK